MSKGSGNGTTRGDRRRNARRERLRELLPRGGASAAPPSTSTFPRSPPGA